LSAEDYSTVVASGPAGSGKTTVLLRLKEYLEWAEETGAVRRALFMYYDLRSLPGRYLEENKALELLKRAAGVLFGAAEAAGGIARALKAGDASGIVNATKGGIRALASALPSQREREPLGVKYYMEVAAAAARGRVKALKPEYAALVFDNVESGEAVAVTEMASRIASGLYSEFGVRAVAFVVTTPLGMKRVARRPPGRRARLLRRHREPGEGRL